MSALGTTDILRTALAELPAQEETAADIPALLSALQDIHSIPSFRPTESAPNSIVSFRCMLQDTTSQPEVFMPVLETDEPESGSTGQGEDIDYSRLKERAVVWAVGVPGESSWVQDTLVPNARSLSASPKPIEIHPSIAHKFPCVQSGEGSEAERAGAFIKFYDDSTHSPLTIHTVIGLLTFAPSEDPSAFPLLSSGPSLSPDSSLPLLPTIHVLKTTSHTDSLVPVDKLPLIEPGKEWHAIRTELRNLICQIGLGGEEAWVGEWVLGLICQRNQPPLHPLTASLLPPQSTPLPLRYLLPHLLPTFHSIPISISTLNKSHFHPSSTKNEDLQAGALQLPKGGTLWIEEAGLGEGGVLGERGLGNFEAIKKVMGEQKIEFSFPFSSFWFPMDVNVLVIGDAKGGTLLPVDVKIPLQSPSKSYATEEEVEAALPGSERMNQFRALIARAREGTLVVPPDVSEAIQSHFVNHRQIHGPQSLSGEELGLRMKFARSLALSRGQTKMDLETWQDAWRLDELRLGQADGWIASDGSGKAKEKLVGR
ncbi:Conserved membrane protein [Phaffia rhodozyma]|uniref:Conserved membrane protein n=1 Tax=Phaffia rhodozyma TaxID=264483 RepID=A0A0F7SNU3_PHARH|nr:Conserved membrane protein [Phaffia rhodozyma]